jgi:hypothetical protein
MLKHSPFDAFVIQVDGETAGIIVRLDRGFRFYATTNDFVGLEGRQFRGPRDAQRAARDRAVTLRVGRNPSRGRQAA